MTNEISINNSSEMGKEIAAVEIKYQEYFSLKQKYEKLKDSYKKTLYQFAIIFLIAVIALLMVEWHFSISLLDTIHQALI